MRHLNLEVLPVIGEGKYVKHVAEGYGHVVIRVELETDEKFLKHPGLYQYTYSWEVGDEQIPKKDYQRHILDQLNNFVGILTLCSNNDVVLRFTIIDGSYRK